VRDERTYESCAGCLLILEDALLDAALEELQAMGYKDFTMQGVADRAKTNRSVINRRWNSKAELVLAIVRRNGSIISMDPPNTGTLRTDVLALMSRFVSKFEELGTDVIIGIMSDSMTDSSPSFDLQGHITESNLKMMSVIMDGAVARGEARADISPMILTLPIDIVRAELLISARTVTKDFTEKVTDEIFLPLVKK